MLTTAPFKGRSANSFIETRTSKTIHHRALHDYGYEEKWWGQRDLDPLKEAQKLWQRVLNEI